MIHLVNWLEEKKKLDRARYFSTQRSIKGCNIRTHNFRQTALALGDFRSSEDRLYGVEFLALIGLPPRLLAQVDGLAIAHSH